MELVEKVKSVLGHVELDIDNGLFFINEKAYDVLSDDVDKLFVIEKVEKTINIMNDCETPDELNELLKKDFETEIWDKLI